MSTGIITHTLVYFKVDPKARHCSILLMYNMKITFFSNTDTIVHIGNEEFHCHHIILQIYSNYFNANAHGVMELCPVKLTCTLLLLI